MHALTRIFTFVTLRPDMSDVFGVVVGFVEKLAGCRADEFDARSTAIRLPHPIFCLFEVPGYSSC